MLSINTLSWKNLKSYSGRSAALILFSFLMALTVFGGSLLVSGIRRGLTVTQNRLGADIIITPADAKNEFDAQTFLLQAEPGYFYMSSSVLDEILAVDDVQQASPQLFLASASSGCCSAKLQIIAFDPESDFTIQPWIRESFGTRKMGLLDIIVGSNVTVPNDYIIRLYNNDCHVVGQFAPTGSTLDNAVYTNFETVRVLTQSSIERGLNKYGDFDMNNVISSVMVRVKPGVSAETAAEHIKEIVPDISAATSQNMVSGISKSLDSISKTVRIFIGIFGVIGFIMTVLIFALMIHERSREFAALRAMGADKGILSNIVISESLIVNIIGGIMGILISLVVMVGFRNLIEMHLGVGFVILSSGKILILAASALILVLMAAALSAWIAIQRINKIDAAQELKEGN